jgi:hypothetical protein
MVDQEWTMRGSNHQTLIARESHSDQVLVRHTFYAKHTKRKTANTAMRPRGSLQTNGVHCRYRYRGEEPRLLVRDYNFIIRSALLEMVKISCVAVQVNSVGRNKKSGT